MNECRFGVSPVNYPDPDPEGLTAACDCDTPRSFLLTCFLFFFVDFVVLRFSLNSFNIRIRIVYW